MTSAGRAWAKGVCGVGYGSGGGMDGRCGLCIQFGSQSWQNSRSFAKSVIISDAEHHRKGHGDPPKVSLRETNPMSLKEVQLAAAE